MGLGLIVMMPENAWRIAQTILKQHATFEVVPVGKVVKGNHEVRLIK